MTSLLSWESRTALRWRTPGANHEHASGNRGGPSPCYVLPYLYPTKLFRTVFLLISFFIFPFLQHEKDMHSGCSLSPQMTSITEE